MVVVSPNKGPQYRPQHTTDYVDPQKGTPNLGKLPCRAGGLAAQWLGLWGLKEGRGLERLRLRVGGYGLGFSCFFGLGFRAWGLGG